MLHYEQNLFLNSFPHCAHSFVICLDLSCNTSFLKRIELSCHCYWEDKYPKYFKESHQKCSLPHSLNNLQEWSDKFHFYLHFTCTVFMFQWSIIFHRISLRIFHHVTNSMHNIGLPHYRSMSYLSMKAEDRKYWLKTRTNCKLNFRIFLINFYKALKHLFNKNPMGFLLLFDFSEMVTPSKMLQTFQGTQINRFHSTRILMNKVRFSCKAICSLVKDPLQHAFKDYLTVSKTSVPSYCISLAETWKQKRCIIEFQTTIYLTWFNYCLSSVLSMITVKFITSTNKTLIMFSSVKKKLKFSSVFIGMWVR